MLDVIHFRQDEFNLNDACYYAPIECLEYFAESFPKNQSLLEIKLSKEFTKKTPKLIK
jgi:hypothetical protein